MIEDIENSAEKLMKNSSEPRNEQRLRTRRRIIEVTRELISQGRYMVTISDIARAAKITQPYFYNHFSCVQDVVYVIAEEIYNTNAGGFNAPPDVNWSSEEGFLLLRGAVESGFAKWKENYAINAICMLLGNREEGRFRELQMRRYQFWCKIFAGKIREAQQQGNLNPNIDPALRSHQCVNIMIDTAQRYDSLISAGFSAQQIIDNTTHLLISGMGYRN